ncbi:MAG: 23S rRNA (adenine(2030)-N(6))-methyltransferase RlmJ [Acidisphaera sp.]|nr:23S rRNA (adenine(2030)-N(6))-methyltransferase RlmJ [Acidisphaera sp.]
MNYRHQFHAGNFADCVKHALLLWIVRAMQRKPGAITALDTHAGPGAYDLDAGPAERTGEWRSGIARILPDPPETLRPYAEAVGGLRCYPGSPMLLRGALRPQDRLICCELHPEEHAALRRRFARDPQVAVHWRDGYEAVGALLPPTTARGLVLIDPPFERRDEYASLQQALSVAHRRWPVGVLAAWYPIKHRAPPRSFHAGVRESGIRDLVAAELWLRAPLDASRLNGCGLLVVQPPFGFEDAAREILAALRDRLGEHDAGDGWAVERIVDE